MAGRPPKHNDPASATALQASLLAEAARAGVPVSPETLDRVAGSLVRLGATDLRVLGDLADAPAVVEALGRLATDDPEAFLRQLANLMEFSRPRLARVEQKVEGQGNTFIVVEQRPEPPKDVKDRIVSEQ